MMRPGLVFTALLSAACGLGGRAVPAAAQDPIVAVALPDSVAETAIGVYNRDGTIRLNGESQIAPGTRVEGAVAVLNGPLRIGGTVAGDVVVINGDVELLESARVDGSVLVVGGDILRQAGARVAGTMRSFREPLRFRYDEGRLVYVPPHLERGISAGHDWGFGRADLFVAAHGSYNRVEGLPIAVGPRLRIGRTNPTRLHALAIIRTAAGASLDPDRLGYALSAEQEVGGSGVTAAARLFSEVAVIESANVTDRESSLATFLLHQDYRDHYEREGYALGVRFGRPDLTWGAELWYRDEEHGSVVPRSPWTLFDNDDPWRPEPLIAEGRLRTLALSARYDTRNDPDDPSFGWLVQGSIEQGLGGNLALVDADLPAQNSARTDFNTASVDIRRYARLSPYSRLAVRFYTAGSVDGRALPPQRQHTMGGEGSLPAFGLLQFDCDARRNLPPEARSSPYYGCDRLALFQMEYQANSPIMLRLGERVGIARHFTNAVRWVAFFDAGRAWTEPAARAGRGGGADDFSADAGIGLRVGALGVYWGVPLSGSDKQVNFFVRIGPRL